MCYMRIYNRAFWDSVQMVRVSSPTLIRANTNAVYAPAALVPTSRLHFVSFLVCPRTGLVSGNWDIKPYNEKNPLDESESDSNVIRGRWNADTKAVFLDEYDDEGNVTTANINGFVSFEKQTLVRYFWGRLYIVFLTEIFFVSIIVSESFATLF